MIVMLAIVFAFYSDRVHSCYSATSFANEEKFTQIQNIVLELEGSSKNLDGYRSVQVYGEFLIK